MKKTIIRSIGVLLIVFGTMKTYACMNVVFVLVPIAFDNGLKSLGNSAFILNLAMAGIELAKVAGGLGLLWLKQWAKWVTAIAASLHVLILAYFGIPIWIKVLKGTFEWPEEIPFWRDPVTIGVNILLILILFVFLPNNSQQHPLTEPR